MKRTRVLRRRERKGKDTSVLAFRRKNRSRSSRKLGEASARRNSGFVWSCAESRWSDWWGRHSDRRDGWSFSCVRFWRIQLSRKSNPWCVAMNGPSPQDTGWRGKRLQRVTQAQRKSRRAWKDLSKDGLHAERMRLNQKWSFFCRFGGHWLWRTFGRSSVHNNHLRERSWCKIRTKCSSKRRHKYVFLVHFRMWQMQKSADLFMNWILAVNKSFVMPAGVPLASETHGGEDVPIYARGPMSHLFHATHEQSYIAHAMAYASCVGTNLRHCQRQSSSPRAEQSVTFTVFTSVAIVLMFDSCRLSWLPCQS